MSKLDQFSQRVLTISLSLMGLILCTTLFFATVSPAAAEQNRPTNFPSLAPGDGYGKIMMDYTSVHVPSQDKTYYEVIVWNTETGVSKLYFYDYESKGFKAYGGNVQLPRNPLD